jgi:hypothetical protein
MKIQANSTEMRCQTEATLLDVGAYRLLRDNPSMSLLDDIRQLREKYALGSQYERMVLDLAASLLELIYEETTGTPPERVTLWTFEEYELLPGTFEMLSSRVVPKHWQLYADSRAAKSGPDREQME